MPPPVTPRNKTGCFLGSEVMVSGKPIDSPTVIPPLHIGRGRSVKTCAEARRHRQVESIREKETYKGFTGSSLNSLPRPKTSPSTCHYRKPYPLTDDATPTVHYSNERVDKLISPNPRLYTSVNNDGVSHREFLSYAELAQRPSPSDMSVELATDLVKKSGMRGPTHYYTVLCQKNPEALKTLLRSQRLENPRYQYTGLNIRGYKKAKSQTRDEVPPHSAKPSHSKELLVPQPFIQSGPTRLSAGARLYNRQPMHYSNTSPSHQSQVVGSTSHQSHGAGHLNRIVGSASHQQRKNIEFEDDAVQWLGERSQNNMSPASASDEHAYSAITNNIGENINCVMPMSTNTATVNHTKDTNSKMSEGHTTISPKIDIAIETDDGGRQPADIDEIEEVLNQQKNHSASTHPSKIGLIRRSSIADRINKLKIGENAASLIMEEAEERKKNLENLLAEHELLVRTVSCKGTDESTAK